MALACGTFGADNKPTPGAPGIRPAGPNPAAPNPAGPPATNDMSKVSYAIGMNLGMNFKRQGVELNLDQMMKGLQETLAGNPTMTEEEARGVMIAFSNTMRQKQQEQQKIAGEKNQKEGQTFLAENAKKEGVKTTPSGLQYKVLVQGSGPKPSSNDTVTVHYRGTLIDGTEFDSSYKRGEPATFPVTGVIKGWTEALQMMNTGSKYQLFIPSNLAYGEFGSGPNIGPNSVLIFDVELISIKENKPQASANPTTQVVSGEIIKVPSAEELKKGAKIEVIKPGEEQKYIDEERKRREAEQKKK